jgi:hypothetical protein
MRAISYYGIPPKQLAKMARRLIYRAVYFRRHFVDIVYAPFSNRVCKGTAR